MAAAGYGSPPRTSKRTLWGGCSAGWTRPSSHEAPADDPTTEAVSELARLEGLKRGLAELVGSGGMDLAEFGTARAANERAMQSLRQAMARSAEEEALQRTRAEAVDLWAKWDELDVDGRRRVVHALAERVEVGPAVRGRNFYSPERVKVTYR